MRDKGTERAGLVLLAELAKTKTATKREAQLTVTVEMDLCLLRIYRRAIAEATDEGLIEVRRAAEIFNRLDELRWAAEEQQGTEGLRN